MPLVIIVNSLGGGHTHTHTHTHMHTRTYIHTLTHSCTYMHTHAHTYTHAHIHSHTYTHAYWLANKINFKKPGVLVCMPDLTIHSRALLKDPQSKGHSTFDLSIKNVFCGPYRTMTIQLQL